MKDNRDYFERAHALSAAVIGFEFEFFSNITKGRAADALSKLLGKKVEVSDKYHSKIKVTSDKFKLEPDYSGGSNMFEFITGPLNYNEAIPIMIKTLQWIDENGWTNEKSAFQFSVSFNKNRPDIKDDIMVMDQLKFILGLDESFILSKFANRSKNVYAKSIKRVLPRNRYSILENINTIDPKMFKIPSDKYYGVNFTKAKDGYLEFRYLGGKDYQKKISDIREVIDYVVIYLYDLLSKRLSGYTKEDLEKLREMMSDYGKIVKCFSNPELFFMYYPDFHVFVDLKGFDENIKTYFPSIRDKIFDLVVEGGITDCYFNYDTSTGRYQVKDARIRNAFEISDVDIVNCDVKGSNIRKCNIYHSKVRKSSVSDCYIVNGNEVVNSKVEDTIVDPANTLKECFINCPQKSVNCDIEGGVFRAGILGDASRVSKETQKVKGWNEVRSERFVTDRKLQDLNDKYFRAKFGDINY
jgi:hypothetical protein